MTSDTRDSAGSIEEALARQQGDAPQDASAEAPASEEMPAEDVAARAPQAETALVARDGAVVVDVGQGTHVALRLGRAFGTLLRQRTGGAQHVVVSWTRRSAPSAAGRARDGVVSGLVLCGHHVHDVADGSPELWARALEGTAIAAVVRIAAEGDAGVAGFAISGRPLEPEAVSTLIDVAASGEWSAGEGSLAVVDVTASRGAREEGAR
jgi:hypothetical protein